MSDKHQGDDDVELCMACGLCCDGTLFSFVPLNDADTPSSLEVEISINDENGKLSFAQPCNLYSPRGCAKYANRPTACREFHCYLIEAYRRRDIASSDVRATIGQARQLMDSVTAALKDKGLSCVGKALPVLWHEWNACAQGEAGLAFRREHAEVVMKIAALTWYLEQHFRPGETTDSLGRGSGKKER